jgi:hypothetical protein
MTDHKSRNLAMEQKKISRDLPEDSKNDSNGLKTN